MFFNLYATWNNTCFICLEKYVLDGSWCVRSKNISNCNKYDSTTGLCSECDK